MPRYEDDPTKVAASIEVYPKDDYEMVIGEPKAFDKLNSQGKPSYGIRYTCTIMNGAYNGKKFIKSLYQQSEGGQAMGKQFLMAALGYGKGRVEEQRFNTDFAGKDWSFDTDSGACGDAWREVTGKRVIAHLDVSQNPSTGDEQQKDVSWRPLAA